MIVVAHPDDELLGLGATMNRLIQEQQVQAHVVILGEGITSRTDKRDVELVKKDLEIHKKNIARAQASIGYQSVSVYDFPDNRFDSVDLLDIIKVIEKEKSQFQPDIIFTHHAGDLNVDHRYAFQAVITACRPLQGEIVRTIICFETPSGTEWRASNDPYCFIPNMFISVKEKNIEAKIHGMESYEFEKRAYPHPRSPEALKIIAQKHGISIGSDFAEAFYIVRHLA